MLGTSCEADHSRDFSEGDGDLVLQGGSTPGRRISAAPRPPADRGCDSAWCINAYPEQLDACAEQVIRETDYFIWERLGAATIEIFGDEVSGHDNEYLQDKEKILAGRPDANILALLTKDVPGG